jgi:hypothetical protein
MLKQPVTSPPRRVGCTTRTGELDLLRALVVVGLVFFHTAVIFAAGEFPVKAGRRTVPPQSCWPSAPSGACRCCS